MPLDLSITVHGEFELARQVLVYLSTIINSSAYKGLVTTLFILVFTLMLMSGMLEVLFGNFRTFDSWVKAFFTGVFIYAIFLSGAARVTVYDDITGRSYTQGNIPPGIALMMWFPNRIATGIEKLVRSYLAPSLPLSPFAYEHGVSMIREAYNGKLVAALSQVIPNQVWRSAGAYVEDCVALEAARSASYESKLYYGDNPYLAWGDAINYFFYTYTSLDASGRPFPPGTPDKNVSCAEAWNRLNAYFKSDDWTTATRYFCKLMSLGDDNISVTACLDLMQEVFSRYITNGVTLTPEEIAKNVFAGVVYYNFLASLDSSIAVGRVAAYSRAQAELMGRGIVAQDWIPIMKTVFFIFACALIPLVFLFIATGTGGVKYLIGLFVWWMIWCGADAVVYCLWVTRAEKLFEVVSEGGKLGLAGLQDLWFLSSKALAILGSMRSLGFLIAGTMTYALFRFGGAALAHMATILGGTVSASAPKVAGYISPDEQAWSQTYEALAKYNQQLAEYRALHTPDFFRYVAEGKSLKTAAEVEAAHEFAGKVGAGSPSGAVDLLSRAYAGGLIKTTASGLPYFDTSLQALSNYYGIELSKNVLTAQKLRELSREHGFASMHDFLSAVAAGKAGGEVVSALKWDQMSRFFTGASPADLAGWLSGQTAPSWAIEKKLSEWTGGIPTWAFSDLKVKDFAWDPEKGTPTLLTLGGTLEKRDLLVLADVLDARGLNDTAAGLKRIAEEYGSAELDLTLGPDGRLAHLRVDAGGEARQYDLYHDKDLTQLEKWMRGEAALSAETEEGRKNLLWLRDQARARGWIQGVKEIEHYLAHPNEAGFFRWTLDPKTGKLATLEMKSGSEWKRLDTGVEDRSYTHRREIKVLDREHLDDIPTLYVSHDGHTYRLRDAVWERKGNRVTVEGVDTAGNRIRMTGMLDRNLSGDGQDWRSSIVLTGVEKEIVDAGGYGKLKAGEDFAGKAPLSSILVRDIDRSAKYIRDTVHNEADAQALARKFTEELGIVKATSESGLYGRLDGRLRAGLNMPFLVEAEIGITAALVSQNKDATTVDLVEAYAYDILKSDLLSAEEKAEALLKLRNIVYDISTEKVGRGSAVDATVGPESIHGIPRTDPEDLLKPKVGRVLTGKVGDKIPEKIKREFQD